MAMTWLEEQFADEIKELSNNLLKKETELAECKKQLDFALHLIKELKEYNHELWKHNVALMEDNTNAEH